ncbi:hypothetical protein TrVFT333_005194 [Trichoderma virens FT-333]|nr:hypothetical protein TrVFT333_005194 [Trichoderma virens FT-333]
MTITSRSACLLLLVSALASFVSASPLGGSVFIRDTQCPANTQSCPTGLPNNFCCSQGTSCIPLAGNTTALCCPDGETCEKIQPITCDVSQQDPSKNQNSPIKTSVFDVSLEKCGTNLCCPFGFSCSGDNTQCVKNSDQSISPESASRSSSPSQTTASQTSTSLASATSATAAPTSADSSTPVSSLVVAPVTTTPTSAPTEESTAPLVTSAPDPSPTADASSETPASSSSKSSNPKTISIIGGVIGGCAVLAVLGAIVFLCIRRRNRSSKNGYPEKTGFGRIKHLGPSPQGTSIMVSDPILQPNLYRADFIRKSPSISSSISQRPPQIVLNHTSASQRLSIPNPFSSPSPSNHSPTSSEGSIISDDERNARTGVVESRSRLAPIRAMKASSTRVYPQNVPREQSGENIDVFADPIMMNSNYDYDKRLTHATTFTDLMVEAQLGDVHRGRRTSALR